MLGRNARLEPIAGDFAKEAGRSRFLSWGLLGFALLRWIDALLKQQTDIDCLVAGFGKTDVSAFRCRIYA